MLLFKVIRRKQYFTGFSLNAPTQVKVISAIWRAIWLINVFKLIKTVHPPSAPKASGNIQKARQNPT
jgi:hypothetical protein